MVKARVSAALGDPTPKKNGFLTWNPLKFFEPIGFFMMMYFNVGWGQPVPTSPFMYKNKRKGILLTYTMPMLTNLFLGAASIALLSFVYTRVQLNHHIIFVVINFARANIGLALFNLIPVYPMAMNKLLHLFVSPETSMKLNSYEKPMQIFMFIFLIFGFIQMLIFPVREMIIRAVMF
jgi:Zn-dependent protease